MAEQTDSEHTGAEVCDGLWNQPVIASLESYCLGGFRVGGQQVHGTTHTHTHAHTDRQRDRQMNRPARPVHSGAAFHRTMLNRAINSIRLGGLRVAVIGRHAVGLTSD